jgi:hypothetical protein
MDQAVYFGVRNQPVFLGAKLVYNTAAAIVVAGLLPGWHGVRPWRTGSCSR